MKTLAAPVINGLLILILAACAQSPESIAPAYISPLTYSEHDCDQLGKEMARVSDALTQVSEQQRKARTNDTIGVIFLGLPVASLTGANVSEQVARLKGEEKTLRQIIIEMRC